MTPSLRRATADDLPAIFAATGWAFGFHSSAQHVDDYRPLFDPDRHLLACEPDGSIVGTAGSYDMVVTLPGGAAVPAPGVSWVTVAASHQGRGILRAMMTEQHRGFLAGGEVLSMLTASKSGIYGRFGYGQASLRRSAEIDRRLVRFRPDVPDPGGVRLADPDDMRKHAPAIHRRWAALTPGAVGRSEAWWDYHLRDREHFRDGGSAFFHLLHEGGFASYRIVEGSSTCRVVDFFAADDAAHVALWRVLLGLSLLSTVTIGELPLDDPLPALLDDPRQVRTTGIADGLWLRVLDVAAALSARRYAVEVDTVLDVTDPFLDRGGRFRLRGGPDGADCERSSDAADVTLGVVELGSLLTGASRARALARTGRLQASDTAVLSRVDAAFLAEREPMLGTGF